MPVPIGLNPPVPFVVNPELISRPRPKPSSDKKPVPALTSEQKEESKCVPEGVEHRGGDKLHNPCADLVPGNGFSGCDVLVNGKNFDAMESLAKVAWEVKTDNFETYTAPLKRIVIEKQLSELREERELSSACGFKFSVGVRSKEHRAALRKADPSLEVVVMEWCANVRSEKLPSSRCLRASNRK